MTIEGLKRFYSLAEDATYSECYPHGQMYQLIFQGRVERTTKVFRQL